MCMRACVHVCVGKRCLTSIHACVRVCVRACMRVCVCVCGVCGYVYTLNIHPICIIFISQIERCMVHSLSLVSSPQAVSTSTSYWGPLSFVCVSVESDFCLSGTSVCWPPLQNEYTMCTAYQLTGIYRKKTPNTTTSYHRKTLYILLYKKCLRGRTLP